MLDKELFALLGKDKKYVTYVTFIDILGVLANMAVTACICVIAGYALKGITEIAMYATVITIGIICGIVKALTIWESGKLKNTLGNNVKKKMRSEAFKKIFAMGLGGSKEQTASLTQMTIEGVEQLDSYYTSYLPSFLNAIIAPIILFIVCVCFRWQVAIALIVCLPAIPISIILVSKWAKKIFAKYWDKYISMGNSFLDNLQGMKELKIFDADELKQAETAVKSEEFRKITMKVLVMQLCSLTIIDTLAFGGAGVAIVLAILGATASVNPISPAVALFLILLSAEFFLPMRNLASAFHVAMNGSTAGKKINTFLALDEPKWGDKLPNTVNELSFKNVNFSYDNERYVLSNVNMSFKKGFNAIVGESGCGKSTTVSLLLGAYTPQSGDVKLNGVNVREYDRKAYYSKLASVSHNTYIFNVSIRDNFRLAKSDVSDKEIYLALEQVNLTEFIKEIGGLDYIVLEDSENISGGERQRLALAVNLISDKDIYIFDEATSNIDVESEAIIMRRVQELSQSKIVVVISHRLANVIPADVIYMLDNGKLIEKGTHKDLMKEKGKYSEAYTEQYDLENGYKEVACNA